MSKNDKQKDSVYSRRVRDVMSTDIVAINAGDTIHEALTLMTENRVSALPVVDGHQRCVGIISTTDLVDLTRDLDDDLYQLDLIDQTSRRFLLEKLTHSVGGESVQSYMSEAVMTADPESTIGKAARDMLRNRVHRLPVVDHRDKLVGIISTTDILVEFADAAPD